MAIGKKEKTRQKSMWIPHSKVATTPGHPFYKTLNKILDKERFDGWLERLCEPSFSKGGRPSIPPDVYFRMLMIGYFEGISSERAIAWRCADSLSLREFLGFELTQSTPDHSTLSVWRKRLELKTYEEVFRRILSIVNVHGLLNGEVVGVDSTTLEANAAMRSIIRKDTGDTYREYLAALAREAGIENPTPEELRRFDRTRKGRKTSNKEFESGADPDSRIAKMKDGSTHLAHKAENAIDLESSVVVSATIFPADQGDAQSLPETIETTEANLQSIDPDMAIIRLLLIRGTIKRLLSTIFTGKRALLHTFQNEEAPRGENGMVMRSDAELFMPTEKDASPGTESGCCANGLQLLRGFLPIFWRPEACGESICAAVKTFRNAISSTSSLTIFRS